MTPEPSAPIQTPLSPTSTLSLQPYLPPATHEHTHSQTFFFFFSQQSLPCFSSQYSVQQDCFVLLLGLVLLAGGKAKKQKKKMCWRGWMVKQRMARNCATLFACPVKSCFCVSFQRLCSITAPVLALATVLPYDRKAFKDCAALLLLGWLLKQCCRMTGRLSKTVQRYCSWAGS